MFCNLSSYYFTKYRLKLFMPKQQINVNIGAGKDVNIVLWHKYPPGYCPFCSLKGTDKNGSLHGDSREREFPFSSRNHALTNQ